LFFYANVLIEEISLPKINITHLTSYYYMRNNNILFFTII